MSKTRPISVEEESWLDFEVTNRQEQPKRLEEAAKFLSGVSSISLTIFLKIGESDLKSFHIEESWILSISILCWFLSLILSFLVLFPSRYVYNNNSVQSIQEYHVKVVRRKLSRLRWSVGLFIIALLTATISIYRPRRPQPNDGTAVKQNNNHIDSSNKQSYRPTSKIRKDSSHKIVVP